MSGPFPKKSLCCSDYTTISHRSLGSICDPNPILQCFALQSQDSLLILATQQLKNSKTPSHFKVVREPPLPNKTFIKTITVPEFPVSGKYLEQKVPLNLEAQS